MSRPSDTARTRLRRPGGFGRRLPFAAALLAVAAAALCGDSAPGLMGASRLTAATGFITSSGGQLQLDGAPWRFTGYDAYQLTSASPGYQCGGALSDAQLNSTFAQIAESSGGTVVRTWFFQSYAGPTRWSQYDRVLAAAATHGIRIIPTLVNEWRQCEPDPGGTRYRNLLWYQQGYKQTGDGYPLSFHDFAVAMAAHYANNPTIAFWQIVNEAEAATTRRASCDETAAPAALRAFADDVSGAMKAVDHNHLINLGTVGTGQCGLKEADYQHVYSSPTIDICELHDYTPDIVAGGSNDGEAPDTQNCRAMGKPIFEGEVGIDASVQSNWSTNGTVTPESLTQRAVFFQQKLSAFFDMGGSGFLIWSTSLKPSQKWNVGPGDPTQTMMLAEHDLLGLSSGTVPGSPTRATSPAAPAPSPGGTGLSVAALGQWSPIARAAQWVGVGLQRSARLAGALLTPWAQPA